MTERGKQRKELTPKKVAVIGGFALFAAAAVAFGIHAGTTPDIHGQILPPNLTPQDIWPHPHMPM